MDGKHSPGCFIAANEASILVFRDLIHLVRSQCKGRLVTTLVHILQHVLDGPDGHTKLYIAVAVEGTQRIFVVRHYPPVVNLLGNLITSHINCDGTDLSTILRTPSSVQGVTVSS